MQSWYLLQKRELCEIDQYDLVLIKGTYLAHTIIKRLSKIKKHKREVLLSIKSTFKAWQVLSVKVSNTQIEMSFIEENHALAIFGGSENIAFKPCAG